MFLSISFSYIPRSTNMLADSLAKTALREFCGCQCVKLYSINDVVVKKQKVYNIHYIIFVDACVQNIRHYIFVSHEIFFLFANILHQLSMKSHNWLVKENV